MIWASSTAEAKSTGKTLNRDSAASSRRPGTLVVATTVMPVFYAGTAEELKQCGAQVLVDLVATGGGAPRAQPNLVGFVDEQD